MSLLKFEIKKIWRQKKLFWLLFAVLFCVGLIYWQNYSQQEKMKERALESIQPYIDESDGLYHYYKTTEGVSGLDKLQMQQMEHIIEIGTVFFKWRGAIQNEEWGKIPAIEHEFLSAIALLEQADGDFSTLVGEKREQAIQKNDWLLAQGLPFVDEEFPLSPALVLKESATILWSALGILLVVLLFGNTLIVEKEQQTLLTLKTQPIPKWERIIVKYSSLLLVTTFFLGIVIAFGWLIPFLFGNSIWNFNYPQLITAGDTFTYISTTDYLLRMILLFSCAALFVFSLVILLSTRLKSSFSVLVGTALVGGAGFWVTDLNPVIQMWWNPFQFFRVVAVVSQSGESSFWLYPFTAICWSGLLLLTSIWMHDREQGMFMMTDQKRPFDQGRTRHFVTVKASAIFEWRKMKRRGLLRQLSIVLGLFIFLGYFMVTQLANEKEISYIANLEEEILFYEEELIPFTEEEIASLDDSNGAEKWESQLTFYHDILANYKSGMAGYEHQDWNAFYNYQLFENSLLNGSFSSVFINTGAGLDSFTLESSIEEKKWLLEQDIRPVFSGHFLPSIYGNWGNLKEQKKKWHEDNRKVDNSGLFSLYLYFNSYLYVIPLLLLVVVVGAGIAGERGKKPTIQLLKTQPIAVRSIFLGKLLNALIVGCSGLVGINAFILVIGTIFNRFGDWNYPILHYNSKSIVESPGYNGMRAFEGGYHFMPLGEYLVKGIVLFLFILLFMIALSHVLALFISRSFGVYTSLALVSGIGYLLSERLGEYAQFSPFLYLNIARVVNGEISTVLNNPGVTVFNGCMVLFVFSIILIILGYVGLRSRTTI
ncbi:ABC transporter permease [Sporosarcina sp. YIM B06819]|uniref:ABC transporter permease n=1 Tax=Sporosarcina sp. YIM B06819 TaxID=3081769 RepID=UPI00298CAB69|nr:ABC transporter permease subunit [Sporosarcina sp. YIM B06819]